MFKERCSSWLTTTGDLLTYAPAVAGITLVGAIQAALIQYSGLGAVYIAVTDGIYYLKLIDGFIHFLPHIKTTIVSPTNQNIQAMSYALIDALGIVNNLTLTLGLYNNNLPTILYTVLSHLYLEYIIFTTLSLKLSKTNQRMPYIAELPDSSSFTMREAWTLLDEVKRDLNINYPINLRLAPRIAGFDYRCGARSSLTPLLHPMITLFSDDLNKLARHTYTKAKFKLALKGLLKHELTHIKLEHTYIITGLSIMAHLLLPQKIKSYFYNYIGPFITKSIELQADNAYLTTNNIDSVLIDQLAIYTTPKSTLTQENKLASYYYKMINLIECFEQLLIISSNKSTHPSKISRTIVTYYTKLTAEHAQNESLLKKFPVKL